MADFCQTRSLSIFWKQPILPLLIQDDALIFRCELAPPSWSKSLCQWHWIWLVGGAQRCLHLYSQGVLIRHFLVMFFVWFLYWGPVTLETELGSSSSVYRMSLWRIGVNSFLNVWGKLTSKGLWAWGFSLGEVLNDEFHLFFTGR